MPQARVMLAQVAKMTTTSPYRHGRAIDAMRPSPRVQASSNEANRMPANSNRRLGALYQTKTKPAATASTISGKAMMGRHVGATGGDAGTGDRASLVMTSLGHRQVGNRANAWVLYLGLQGRATVPHPVTPDR